MKYVFATALVLLTVTPVFSQTVSGLMLGLDYTSAAMQNPYVSYENSQVDPTNLQEFSDSTAFAYFPFGWVSWNERGYGELSSYALNSLMGWVAGLLSGRSTYDQYFQGDQKTLFDGRLNGDPDKFFVDKDLFRFVISGAVLEGLPFQAGLQAGLGNRGIHPLSGSTGEGPGVVGFDDDAVVYGGPNAGVGIDLFGILLRANVAYDWYYLLNEGVGDGTTTTIEVDVLPLFGAESTASGFYTRAIYRLGSFDYVKRFAETLPVQYTYSTFTLGAGYVLSF